MRGKRAKEYRKLMELYSLSFGFRPPLQCLVDMLFLKEAVCCKIDLARQLSRVLHNDVKLMITQCSIRHIYSLPVISDTTSSTDPLAVTSDTKTALLNFSRTLELRRCGHHRFPKPLSALDCISSVVDPKQSGINKHRLVLTVLDDMVRHWARSVKAVPTIYIKRSVLILEPMSKASKEEITEFERGKLRGGARQGLGIAREKRKRESEDVAGRQIDFRDSDNMLVKKRKLKGPKQANPLSVKKKRRGTERRPAFSGIAGSANWHGSESRDPMNNKGRKRKRKCVSITLAVEKPHTVSDNNA